MRESPTPPAPRLLDLFCGGGGCSRGYQQAGFHVTGVDVDPQPNYVGDEFHQADALEFPLDGFDAIHASPPCQAYSSLTRLGKGAGANSPMLIPQVRERLRATGLPYVIENVVGAPLENPVLLCGKSFGLGVRRHRLFETNFMVMVPPCGCHRTRKSVGVYGDHPQVSIGMNRAHTLQQAREAMGIDWMTWPELREAIPPIYTWLVGEQLLFRDTAWKRNAGLRAALEDTGA